MEYMRPRDFSWTNHLVAGRLNSSRIIWSSPISIPLRYLAKGTIFFPWVLQWRKQIHGQRYHIQHPPPRQINEKTVQFNPGAIQYFFFIYPLWYLSGYSFFFFIKHDFIFPLCSHLNYWHLACFFPLWNYLNF